MNSKKKIYGSVLLSLFAGSYICTLSRNFFDENNNLFLSLLTSESSLFNKFIFDYLSLNDSKLERERDLLTAEYEKLTTWSAERGFLRLEDLKIKTVSKKKADLICQHRNNYAILALFGKKQNDEHITEILWAGEEISTEEIEKIKSNDTLWY